MAGFYDSLSWIVTGLFVGGMLLEGFLNVVSGLFCENTPRRSSGIAV